MSHLQINDRNKPAEVFQNTNTSDFPLDEVALKMFFNLSPDLFCMVSKEGNFIYLNPSWEKTTGFSPNELLNTPFLGLIHPEDLDHTIKNFTENLGTTGVFITINRCKCKDGSYKWLECRGNTSEDKNIVFAVARDITEQKRIEDDLRIKEERYRLLADNALDVIWTMNIDGTVTYISPAVEQLRGLTVEEAMNQPLDQILTPSSQQEVIGYLYKLYDAIANNLPLENYKGEQEYYRKDGSIMWANVLTFPIQGKDNGPVTLLGVSRDISERKQFEAKLLEQANHLKEIIATKDKFFSIISHDLRSPFNGLLGLLQIIEKRLMSMSLSEIHQYIITLEGSTKKLFLLLENLLEWSRIQTGTFTAQPTLFKLKDNFQASFDLIADIATKKGIIFDIDVPEDLKVFSDERMVEGIIRNLTSNAIKFTEQGGKVSIQTNTIPEGYVQVSVIDTGIGMDQSIMDNLFSLNTKIGRRGTDGEPSSGLGLILVKEFVEKIGGKIWVDSKVGLGTIFHFTIPIA